MLKQSPRRLSNSAAVNRANSYTNVDYAMLATCRIVLDEGTPALATDAGALHKEAPSTTRPHRLGRLFHSARLTRPRASSRLAA